jgi:hypothetical protein
MKTLPAVVFLALVACSPVPAIQAPRPVAGGVRCEQVTVQDSSPEWASITFRVTNDGDRAMTYQGYSPDSPLYQVEVLAGGAWEPSPMGWCGTGLAEQTLPPGGAVDLLVGAARDGQTRRFTIRGLVTTPPVTLDG